MSGDQRAEARQGRAGATERTRACHHVEERGDETVRWWDADAPSVRFSTRPPKRDATPENHHRDEHTPSLGPWRLSLHASRALSVRPGPASWRATRLARPSARRGVFFSSSKLGTNESSLQEQLAIIGALEKDSGERRRQERESTWRSLSSRAACRSIDSRAKDRASPSTMGPTPGAYNYVVTVRPPLASPPHHRADFVVCSRPPTPRSDVAAHASTTSRHTNPRA